MSLLEGLLNYGLSCVLPEFSPHDQVNVVFGPYAGERGVIVDVEPGAFELPGFVYVLLTSRPQRFVVKVLRANLKLVARPGRP